MSEKISLDSSVLFALFITKFSYINLKVLLYQSN